MARYRGGSATKPWEKADAEGRRLDTRQYPELNAVFYSADPAAFINMRIEALSLMACPDQQLVSAYQTDRRIGSVSFRGTTVPDEQDRQRYIQTEAMMIVHHASEALLHLYFAHVEHPECPWLGMASSNDFRAFKKKIAEAVKNDFDRRDIAAVFLGGTSPDDSSIALSQDEFDSGVDGVHRLLWDCALRVLGDSFLYNSVKHGLTAVPIDPQASLTFTSPSGQMLRLHKGATHVYLHRQRGPAAKQGEKEWFFSMEASNPERDLAVARYVACAIGSMWGVAHRKYRGEPSSILLLNSKAVEMAIYAPVQQSMNLLKRVRSELIKIRRDGTVDGTEHDLEINNIPEDWKVTEGTHWSSSRRVELPVRQQDQRIYSTSTRAYLPITPRGFQQG